VPVNAARKLGMAGVKARGTAISRVYTARTTLVPAVT
jgi:hypothetical protein